MTVSPPKALPERTAFSMWLDCFRWTAALLVLFDHTANRLLVRITDVPPGSRSAMFYAYAFLSGFAHQAVMVFFVLSGLLVGGGLWREIQKTGSVEFRILNKTHLQTLHRVVSRAGTGGSSQYHGPAHTGRRCE